MNDIEWPDDTVDNKFRALSSQSRHILVPRLLTAQKGPSRGNASGWLWVVYFEDFGAIHLCYCRAYSGYSQRFALKPARTKGT